MWDRKNYINIPHRDKGGYRVKNNIKKIPAADHAETVDKNLFKSKLV